MKKNNEEIKFIEKYLKATAERTMCFNYSVWFWGDAIAFDGLWDAGELLNFKKPIEFCQKYIDSFTKRKLVYNDHLAPTSIIAKLSQSTKKTSYLDQALSLAQFLSEETPRCLEGAPIYKPELPMYRNTVYVDSIYHMPPFYALLGKLTSENRFYDLAVQEWESHTSVLHWPEKGGFLCHAYDAGYQLRRGYGWGRGSGWALYGMIDTLELLPKKHPAYGRLMSHMKRFAKDILEVQDASGFWRTLLHDEEAYLEASTASFFGAAFEKGCRLGFLGKEFKASADLAWKAFLTRLDSDGSFRGVSACTWAGTVKFDDADMYKTLPTEVNVWGQGSALRFLAERLISLRS